MCIQAKNSLRKRSKSVIEATWSLSGLVSVAPLSWVQFFQKQTLGQDQVVSQEAPLESQGSELEGGGERSQQGAFMSTLLLQTTGTSPCQGRVGDE